MSVTARHLTSLLAINLLAAMPCVAATGTDGGFGYTWRDTADGARYTGTAPDPFTQRLPADSSVEGPIALGMPDGFPYYGQVYNNVWLSDDGWISFTAPGGPRPTPTPIPDGTPGDPLAMVAPFWTDIDASNPARDLVYYGPVASIGGWMVAWGGIDKVGMQQVGMDCILYPDGRIKFQYRRALAIGNTTIGIERDPPVDGAQVAGGGVVATGVDIAANYAIEFLPPPVLSGECGVVPPTPCGVINQSLPGTMPANILYYSCGLVRYEARERVYAITLTQASQLDLTLTGGAALQAFLMDTCSEQRCIRGPVRSVSVPLGPGTYYVSVDAPLTTDEGAFSLTATCTPLGQPITCGTTISGSNVGGSSFFTTYGCAGAPARGGPEAIYSIDVPVATNIRATVDVPSALIDVFVLQPGTGEVTGADCVAWGDTSVIMWDAAPGQYLLVFDSPAGQSGTFSSDTSCNVSLDCTPIAGTVEFDTGRVQTLSGDTSGGTNSAEVYSCDPSVTLDGPESVYEVVMTQPGVVAVYQSGGTAGLNFLFLSSCNEGACVGAAGSGSCAAQLDPGTYYLVVDSPAGVSGPFDLTLVYEEYFNRWSVCEDPFGATMLSDTSSTFWNLSDAAFCITDTRSKNYPDGCHWAMYATVKCGTAMHLPLYDTEGAYVRVFDVFRSEYVYLLADSPTYHDEGLEIRWQDADCDGGSDERWNEVVVDIHFERPEGLCGVFRIEFPPGHSGNVWELYANCAGTQTPQFNIHDTLCGALADYDPLPNVTIQSASATTNCPQITVTYTLKNDGCIDAIDFPVQVLDGGNVIDTDLVPVVPAGGTVTQVFTTTFPGPTNFVELASDSTNVLVECDEGSGACGVSAGVETVELPGCTGVCQVVAAATATPSTTCVGSPVQFDASSSSSSLCPGGVLEYQLRGPTGTQSWQMNPIFAPVFPTGTGDYDVDVRCADPSLSSTCTDTTRRRILVDRPPDFPPAPVQAADVALCNLGVRVTWQPATFPSGAGHYNVYKSDISCAQAIADGPIVVGLTGNSYVDVATVGGTTYFYVVEAEDDLPGTSCVPRGPRTGSVTRVAANGGTCTGVVDSATSRPDLLPRAGTSLRVGGTYPSGGARYQEVYVEMDWTTDRPLNVGAREHFHVLRSDEPDTGFTQVSSDTPLPTTPFFADLFADDPGANPHVWHYLVFTVDACENDNSTDDSFGTGR